jgi:hypothetical protein
MQARDVRQFRQTFTMDALEVGRIRRYHAQQIVRAASHEMAFKDLGTYLHGALESIQRLVALGAQGHLDEELHGVTERAAVEARHVAGDQPGILKLLDAAMAGRRRQADTGTELGDRQTAIALQLGQDTAVQGIKRHVNRIRINGEIGA